MAPEPNLSDPRAFARWNEEMARRFDPEAFHRHPNPLIRWLQARRVRLVRDLLDLRPGDCVLEVGCGPGDLLLALPAGAHLGLDLSASMLRRARTRLGPGARLLLADAERLPLDPASFDRVICSEVLEHTLRPRRVLLEIARILRPGGLAVVSVPEEERINRLKDLLWRAPLARRLLRFGPARQGAVEGAYEMARHMDEAWHLHAFSLELLQGLSPPGLTLERVRSLPLAVFPLHRVVVFRRGR